MIKKLFPTFLRLLVIGLAFTAFPLAQAQSLDAFLENSTLKIGVNSSTMYIAPLGQYAFKADTVFSYRFYLILGNLPAIRKAVYTLCAAAAVRPPPAAGLAPSAGNQQIRLNVSTSSVQP